MSKFPKISNISDLLPKIQGHDQIRVKAVETGAAKDCTVVCYMIQDEDVFTGPNEAWERECRGITFSPDGNVAARTLHKFFNIGEREETQPHNIQWSKVTRVSTKMDGSMVTPVKTDSGFKFKTKKTFDSAEACLADEIVKRKDAAGQEASSFISYCNDNHFTPTFEVTSPRFPIVIPYPKDDLTLLHIRDNETGRYCTEEQLHTLNKFFNSPFSVVENKIADFNSDGIPANLVSWEKLKAAAETATGIEGWVIQFESGEMVKLKTAWYIQLHHSVTFVRYRDIARTVLEDAADDLKSAFTLIGRSTRPILEIEQMINQALLRIERDVNYAVESGKQKNLSQKEMAISNSGNPLFSLIMRAFSGREIDYREYYKKHNLDAWSLEVIPLNE